MSEWMDEHQGRGLGRYIKAGWFQDFAPSVMGGVLFRSGKLDESIIRPVTVITLEQASREIEDLRKLGYKRFGDAKEIMVADAKRLQEEREEFMKGLKDL